MEGVLRLPSSSPACALLDMHVFDSRGGIVLKEQVQWLGTSIRCSGVPGMEFPGTSKFLFLILIPPGGYT